MNSMTHDMTWNVIQKQQGQDIQAISHTEVDEVSGGHDWVGIAEQVVAVVGLAAAAYVVYKK